MSLAYIIPYIITASVYFCAFFGSVGGAAFCFTAGYTYANIVKYRNEHDGQLDFIEVLRQMSPISKKDDDEDLEVEYLLSQEEGDEEVEIIGDDAELV